MIVARNNGEESAPVKTMDNGDEVNMTRNYINDGRGILFNFFVCHITFRN